MDARDRELVVAAKGGERPAFASLVDRYRGRIYALAVSIMGDHEGALALTRETFVRAHRELKKLENPDRFPGWLARIAYQAGRDKRHERLEDSETELAKLEVSDQVAAAIGPAQPANGVTPSGREHTIALPFEKGEAEKALLEALLAALPERVRVALDLRYREGLTYQEIAETLELPRDAVRDLLARGTRKLRAKLRPYLKRRAAREAK